MNINSNFITAAALKGYYTIDNLPTEVNTNQWFKDRFEWYKTQWERFVLPESLNFDNVGKFMKVDKEGDLYHMERIVILAFDGDNLRSVFSYKGKYVMYPLSEDIYTYTKNIDNRDRPNLKEPNGIGVFTAKKINDWLNYCSLYVAALKELSEKNQSKETKNRQIIEQFISDIKKADPKVKVWNWSNEFRVETKNFDVTFKLLDKGTFLSKEIRFKGELSDIIKFAAL